MTRMLGIIGGLGPESTIDYYRSLLARYRKRTGKEYNPRVIIHSLDIRAMLDAFERDDLDTVTSYLVEAAESLASAGADLGLIAANTPHVVFSRLAARSPIPLLSIVDATFAVARQLALKRVALLGTRYSMHGRFYPEVFEPQGIAIVVPEPGELAWIHEIYMNELIPGLFLPETRARLMTIVENLIAREGIDGVILAGTELPLIIRQDSLNGVPLLDTTAIHVDAAIDKLLSEL